MKIKHHIILSAPVTQSDKNAKQRTDHMKTNNYWPAIVSTGLITALLFGTASTVAAIDFAPPQIPNDLKNIQAEADKAASQKPTISANPLVVQIADGKKGGLTTVTWDAGLAHPNAQVMLKSNDQPSVMMTPKKGTGSLPLAVQLGRNSFFLLDGTEFLATVTVTGKASPTPAKPNTSTPPATANAEAEESSSNDTDDQHGKHWKHKNKKKHHHHHDDDQNQGND
jgi:hypothetical protein